MVLATLQHPTKALLRSGTHRSSTEHSQCTPGVMVSAEGDATALGTVLYRRLGQDRQRRLFVAFWRTATRQRCRSSQRQLCGKMTTHQATAVRPRGTGRRRTFSSELEWPPQSPDLAPMDRSIWQGRGPSASSGAFFVEGCSQSSHCPCICCGRGVRCSWQGGQCVKKSPSAVSRCRRRPCRGMIFTDGAFLVRVEKTP